MYNDSIHYSKSASILDYSIHVPPILSRTTENGRALFFFGLELPKTRWKFSAGLSLSSIQETIDDVHAKDSAFSSSLSGFEHVVFNNDRLALAFLGGSRAGVIYVASLY